VTGKLRGRNGVPVGEWVAGSDEQLVRLVDHTGSLDRLGQVLLGGNTVEGGVDRPGLDSSGRSINVGIRQGHDIQRDLWMQTVEVLEQHRRSDPPADDIDA
jgi:hypothetical protein